MSILILCPACSAKFSQADFEFLKNQPSLTVVHEQTAPFIVTTPNASGSRTAGVGGTEPSTVAIVMALDILCCSRSQGTEVDRVRYETARELRDRFLNRLLPALPASLVVHRKNPVPEIPDDADGVARMIKKGMVLAFKVKGTQMTIWYKPGLNLQPQTEMHSYLASLVAEASLTYSETARTLWRETCHVKTNVDLPNPSIRALFEPESPSFQTIIQDLLDQCTDELWGKLNHALRF